MNTNPAKIPSSISGTRRDKSPMTIHEWGKGVSWLRQAKYSVTKPLDPLQEEFEYTNGVIIIPQSKKDREQPKEKGQKDKQRSTKC